MPETTRTINVELSLPNQEPVILEVQARGDTRGLPDTIYASSLQDVSDAVANILASAIKASQPAEPTPQQLAENVVHTREALERVKQDVLELQTAYRKAVTKAEEAGLVVVDYFGHPKVYSQTQLAPIAEVR
jgi:hypothetical protein